MREHAQHSFQYVKHASTQSVTTVSIQMIHRRRRRLLLLQQLCIVSWGPRCTNKPRYSFLTKH